MAKDVILSNDFHRTTVSVCPINDTLNADQIRHIWRVLCGIETCKCGDNGIRGRQLQTDGSTLDYEWDSPSSIRVWKD